MKLISRFKLGVLSKNEGTIFPESVWLAHFLWEQCKVTRHFFYAATLVFFINGWKKYIWLFLMMRKTLLFWRYYRTLLDCTKMISSTSLKIGFSPDDFIEKTAATVEETLVKVSLIFPCVSSQHISGNDRIWIFSNSKRGDRNKLQLRDRKFNWREWKNRELGSRKSLRAYFDF